MIFIRCMKCQKQVDRITVTDDPWIDMTLVPSGYKESVVEAEDCGCADLVPANAEYWRCPKCDAEYF